MTGFLAELKAQEEKLLNCVHCGFCLPACPTYIRLGDEADSPRGRLHFMRALVEGRVSPGSPVVARHLAQCLGCRACESVCPSGVEYGRLLEGARDVMAQRNPKGFLERTLLAAMATPGILTPSMLLVRLLRATGFPAHAARRGRAGGLPEEIRLGLAMIAATEAPEALDARSASRKRPRGRRDVAPLPEETLGRGRRTGVLLGCVQEGLLSRVNRATRRVLEANGFRIVEMPGQGCCGALHAHTGDLEGARRLARANIRCMEAARVEVVAVNAAGCGAAMKEYGHLLEGDPDYADRGESLAEKVKDISEILAGPELRVGAPIHLTVTYDAPCHLLHAQKVADEPEDLLRSIPGLKMVPLPGKEECCGGAGIYGITHPELGLAIGEDKVRAILATGAEVVATGNPGCMMQIGAGLRLVDAPVEVVHPVELVDLSYRLAGVYHA